MQHLPWLAAASGRPEARKALVALAAHRDPQLRATAIRALAEFRGLAAPADVFAKALADQDARVVHAGVAAQFDRQEPLTDGLFAGPALDDDTYLRQASALLIAARGHGEPARCAACFQRSPGNGWPECWPPAFA